MERIQRQARMAIAAAICVGLGACGASDDDDSPVDTDLGDVTEDTNTGDTGDTGQDVVDDTDQGDVDPSDVDPSDVDPSDTGDDTADASEDSDTADTQADAEPGIISCSVVGLEFGLVTFTISSENADMADAFVEYSTDGTEFLTASAGLGNNPSSEATNTEIAWEWDSGADGYPPCADATIRVTVDDGVASPATCSITGRVCESINNCRVVSELGTTAVGPTGVVPAYVPDVGGAPPATTIDAVNGVATHYWDFDYIGVNEGEFNTTATLTDETGANVGNPVVLMSAGMDYRHLYINIPEPCNAPDEFQLVLEGSTGGDLLDLTEGTQIGDVFATVEWTTSNANNVSVSETGLLVAEANNTCATIGWELTTDGSVDLSGECQSGEIVACVDSGGIDTESRGEWLPAGDIDANLPGMPSGPPPPAVGETFGITYVVNTGSSGLGAMSAGVTFDSDIVIPATDVDTRSIGGSTQAMLGQPFAVDTSSGGEIRWNDVDAFATTSGIFDLATVNLQAESTGTFTLESTNEELADGTACNIWVQNTCMPYFDFICPNPPPAGGYATIGGRGDITIVE